MNDILLINENSNSKYFNKYLSILFFFIAWPFISIGVSITFYIFFYIIYKFKFFQKNLFKTNDTVDILLLSFLIYIVINFFVKVLPVKVEVRDIIYLIQWSYWIVVALFFKKYLGIMDWRLISKWTLIGSIGCALNLFFFNNFISLPFIDFNVGRNGFIYSQLALFPLNSYYVLNRYGKTRFLLFLLFVSFIILLTDGRAGGILIILESLLLLTYFFDSYKRFVLILFIILIPVQFTLIQIIQNEATRISIGESVGKVSPRIGALISQLGNEETLSQDESWLIRIIMIQKGMILFHENPWMGVGVNQFVKTDVDIQSIIFDRKFDFVRHTMANPEKLNTVSAHNSFLLILCEYGIIGLFFISAILLIILTKFLSIFRFNDKRMSVLFSIGVVCFTTQLYVAANITGTLTWVFLGLSLSTYGKLNHKIKKSIN
jgi:O-antigen ligase